MCIAYPDGHLEFVGRELNAIPRPDGADKRAAYIMTRPIAR